ncbi:MAG: S8 family serine peptidase [Clostridia bacterium]|nr:S8 family serine peptidase [Clostridia bacterium]
MKRKFIKAISALCAAIFILNTAPAVYAADTAAPVEVIISADREYFANLSEAREYLYELAGERVEITDEYTHVLFGFGAKMPEALAFALDESAPFDVHICGYFEPLSEPLLTYDTAAAYASDMLGIKPAHDKGYTGKGRIVAVIDNGFDISHDVFKGKINEPELTKADIDRMVGDDMLNIDGLPEGQSVYVSEKIPFAFNYTAKNSDVSTLDNHGTHISAIIAGKSDSFTGVAPDAQLLFMKVFDQRTTNASEQCVVSAMEDAITLGADVINLSIGSYSGTYDQTRGSIIDKIAKTVTEAGVTVVCAAGNDGTIGETSSFAHYFDLPYPLAEIPDYGTVNHPGVIDEFISVASARNTHVCSDTLIYKSESGKITRRIYYTDTNASLGIIKTTFVKHFDNQMLEYVPVPGLGRPTDYDSIDVTGKLALIKRGEIQFIEKVKTAAEKGAIGAIIYDYAEGPEVYMGLEGCTIPAVYISMEDGEFLLRAKSKQIVLDSALGEFVENEYAYTMSDFSSRGVTPDLKLKPDVAGIGESVYSAATGNTYTSLSGTSMATPFITGIVALLCERIEAEKINVSGNDRPGYIKNIIKNTAVPMSDPETGVYFSPRAQGAGLASLEAALRARVLITDPDGSSTLELEKLGAYRYALDFTIENTFKAPLDFDLSLELLCDEFATVELSANGVTEEYIFNTLTSRALTKADINIENTDRLKKSDGNTFTLTLKPDEKLSGRFVITLDSKELEQNKVFENGYFIDGYLVADGTGVHSSLPFTGFFGDYENAPVFDKSVYGTSIPFFTGNALASRKSDDSLKILGSTDGTVNGAKAELVAFSPNGDGELDTLIYSPSLLRNISGLSVEILDADKKVIYTDSLAKNPLVKGGAERNETLDIWNGSDGLFPDYIFEDGKYTARITAHRQGQKSPQSIVLDFVIDTQKPKYWLASHENKNGFSSITIGIKDNHAISDIRFYNDNGEDIELESKDKLPSDSQSAYITYDVSDISLPYIWADITDFAMNTKTVKIRIP